MSRLNPRLLHCSIPQFLNFSILRRSKEVTRKTQVIWLTIGAVVCVAGGMMAGKLTHGVAMTARAQEEADKERQSIEVPPEPMEIVPEASETAVLPQNDLGPMPPDNPSERPPPFPRSDETITAELLPPPTPVTDEPPVVEDPLPPQVTVATDTPPVPPAVLVPSSNDPPVANTIVGPTPSPLPPAPQPILQSEPVRAVPALVMFASRSRVQLHSQQIPLTGTFSCTLDEHRSLVLPAELMKQLDDTERGVLFARPGPEQCLWLYTPGGLAHLADRLERQGMSDAQARLARRLNFARSESISLDQAGRLTIPEHLAKFAGLEKNTIVIGVADHLEIWDAQTWHKYIEPQEPVVPASAPQ